MLAIRALSRLRHQHLSRLRHQHVITAGTPSMAPEELDGADGIAAWIARLPVGPPPEEAAAAVSIRGLVTGSRKNKAVTFCDVLLDVASAGDDGTPAPPAVQLVLQRGRLAGDDSRFKAFSALLAPGATVAAVGLPACDRPGGLSLYATQLSLLRCDATAASVTRIVELAANDALSHAEACVALSCQPAALTELVTLRDHSLQAGVEPQQSTDEPPKAKKQRKYVYKQAIQRTARCLQGLPPEREARQRAPKLSKADAAILDAVEARVRSRWAVQPGGASSSAPEHVCARVSAAVAAQLQDDQSLRDPSACCCRGPGSRADYFHGKKKPQVEWLLKEICAMVEALPGSAEAAAGRSEDDGGNRGARILDVGGGRGDLALCVAAALPNCTVTVVDTNGKSIADGAARATATSLTNIEFICGDASQERPGPPPDIIIGLHACGGLTDVILQLATVPHVASRRFPSFLVVPCCFNKHLQLVSQHCNWAVQSENGALAQADVESLVRLAESKERSTSHRAMLLINSLRLQAVDQQRVAQQHSGRQGAANGDEGAADLRLMEFSEEFSLRNMVLAGDSGPTPL